MMLSWSALPTQWDKMFYQTQTPYLQLTYLNKIFPLLYKILMKDNNKIDMVQACITKIAQQLVKRTVAPPKILRRGGIT